MSTENCRACGALLLTKNAPIADGCPCNSPRGVNHGLVPVDVCTCVECDPAQTGSSRVREKTTMSTDLATELDDAADVYDIVARMQTEQGSIQSATYSYVVAARLRQRAAVVREEEKGVQYLTPEEQGYRDMFDRIAGPNLPGEGEPTT
jgi:hypothetical protein